MYTYHVHEYLSTILDKLVVHTRKYVRLRLFRRPSL